MPQTERKDEREAREVVEKVLGVELFFADLNGDVDFRFIRDNRQVALEVSRLTRSRDRQGSYEWSRESKSFDAPQLRSSWLVLTDGYPRFDGIDADLGQALHHLEIHSLDCYGESMDWWLGRVPTLNIALHLFRQRKVRAAYAYQREGSSKDVEGISKIHLGISGTWMSDGPNGAVEELNKCLALPLVTKKFDKLDRAGADERHLWLWVDSFTLGRLREPIRDFDDHRSLPVVAPDLPSFISHLWLVDDVAKHGWLWAANQWSWVNRDLPLSD